MSGYVYIIRNINKNNYYIGSTNNFERRFKEHQNGYVRSTKYLRSFEIELVQEYNTIKQAIQIELKLKKLKRKDCIKKIIKDGYIKIS
ncbi:MAG: GIY-YIG nuclease family protein [bacterium]|nr:GIY-YIG nuclease family protein [bacterium]